MSMKETKHILLIANALATTEIQEVKASIDIIKMQPDLKLQMSVLYVKPYFPTCYFHIPAILTLAEDIENEAKTVLDNVANTLNLPIDHRWIATGRIKSETCKLACALGVDFILTSSALHSEFTSGMNYKSNRHTLTIRTIESLQKTAA